MPWVRLDENFADHPKVERVGPLAAWLHVAAICYASRHLTDGRIPKAKAVRLVDIPDPAEHVSALLSEGVWVENGTDYVIHDYLDYQPSRADVLKERSAARERMAKKRSTASRSPEVPPNIGRSSASPTRPDPNTSLLTSSGNSRDGAKPVDDDDLSTGVPDETWAAYAELRLHREPAGKVQNPTKWKAATARNARLELIEQATRWWAMFDLTPRRLAECLADDTAPRNAPRRQTP